MLYGVPGILRHYYAVETPAFAATQRAVAVRVRTSPSSPHPVLRNSVAVHLVRAWTSGAAGFVGPNGASQAILPPSAHRPLRRVLRPLSAGSWRIQLGIPSGWAVWRSELDDESGQCLRRQDFLRGPRQRQCAGFLLVLIQASEGLLPVLTVLRSNASAGCPLRVNALRSSMNASTNK